MSIYIFEYFKIYCLITFENYDSILISNLIIQNNIEKNFLKEVKI